MDDERLWTATDVTHYLCYKNVGSVYNMLSRITETDWKVHLGRHWRFIKRKVVARVEAALFRRALDEDGKPVTPARKLRAA
jgi:hypothetical protein